MNESAGIFDRRITVQLATEFRDPSNDVIQIWADAFQLWASKSDSRGREFFGAAQIVRDADTAFTVRDSSEVRAIAPESHRITFAGRVFEIIGIAEGRERLDTRVILTTTRPDGRGARGPTQYA